MSRDTLATGASARMYRRADGRRWTVNGTVAETPWSDGCPVDSGTAFFVSNDITHCRAESGRQLFTDVGVGALSVVNNGGWDNLDEPAPPNRTLVEEDLSWAPTVARCYGPFPILRDTDLVAEGRSALPRSVKVAVRCKSNGSATLTIYFAATTTRQPPAGGSLATSSVQIATTTSATAVKLTATLGLLRGGHRMVQGSADNDYGTGVTRVEEYYVWVGWEMVSGSAKVLSACAWELLA